MKRSEAPLQALGDEADEDEDDEFHGALPCHVTGKNVPQWV